MHVRATALARPFAAGAACLALLAAAGCSTGPSSGSAAGSSQAGAAKAKSPDQVLALAAGKAGKVTSFTATMDITTTGGNGSHMKGTLKEQTKPVLLVDEKYSSIEMAGSPVPGGMEIMLTGSAFYMKMAALSQALGKPWVGVKLSALKKSSGVNFAQFLRQARSNNPLALGQMLSASRDITKVGTATVAGVRTTEYSGSYKISAGLAKLDPSLRKTLQPALKAAGFKTAQFKVWIDGQNEIRKMDATEQGSGTSVHTVMVITSINQPLHITVPPASQVASMPGM